MGYEKSFNMVLKVLLSITQGLKAGDIHIIKRQD